MLDVKKLMEAGLRPIQLITIQVLLFDPNKTAAARYVGISRTTIWRWMKNPLFVEALKEGMREQINELQQEFRTRSIV